MFNVLRKKDKKQFVEIPREHDPVYHYPLPPMTEFLATPKGHYWFNECMKDQHSEENLVFYMDVCGLKSNEDMTPLECAAEIERIWEVHVNPASRTVVNLPVSIEQPITEKVKAQSWDVQIFDVAVEHILRFMFENGYLEFRKSPHFLGWLKEVEKKKA